jgi:hypothetical protein
MGSKNLFKRRLRAKLTNEDCRKKLAILGFIFIGWCAFWAIGFTDFLFEVDFKDFRWPPFVDVREQVVLQMLGERPKFLFQNDWLDYNTAIEPVCTFNRLTRRKSILIIVKTAPHRLQNRDAIRAAWGKAKQFSNFRIRTIFVMGKMNSKELETYGNTLEAEQKQFGDLLVGDFIDGYRNNTFKLMHSLKFAQNYCSTGPVSYVFLVDDDYMVSIKNLITEVEKHPPNERLYMGWRFDTSPFRLVFSKHRVSLNDYPFSQYPPYISAGAVLLTSQTVREFYLAIQHLKIYPFDDIFAGIIAYKLGILPQHNDNFRFWSANPEVDVFDHAIAAHGYSPKDLIQQNYRVNNHI